MPDRLLPAPQYTLAFAVNAVGLSAASLLNTRLLRRFTPRGLALGGLTALVGCSAALLPERRAGPSSVPAVSWPESRALTHRRTPPRWTGPWWTRGTPPDDQRKGKDCSERS
jgi:hypothetical protein